MEHQLYLKLISHDDTSMSSSDSDDSGEHFYVNELYKALDTESDEENTEATESEDDHIYGQIELGAHGIEHDGDPDETYEVYRQRETGRATKSQFHGNQIYEPKVVNKPPLHLQIAAGERKPKRRAPLPPVPLSAPGPTNIYISDYGTLCTGQTGKPPINTYTNRRYGTHSDRDRDPPLTPSTSSSSFHSAVSFKTYTGPNSPAPHPPTTSLTMNSMSHVGEEPSTKGFATTATSDVSKPSVILQQSGARPKISPRKNKRKSILRKAEGEMTYLQKSVISNMWNKLLDNVRAVDIVDDLIQSQIFTIDHRDEILKSGPTHKDQTAELLKLLMTRGGRAYAEFIKVIKIKYDFIYHECQKLEDSIHNNRKNSFSYHEPPTSGEALKNAVSGILQIMPTIAERRRHKRELKSWVKKTEMDTRHSQEQSLGRTSGQMVQRFVSGNIVLKPDQFVVIIGDEDDNDFVSILTRHGKIEVPRSIIKNFGDPSQEKYYYKDATLQSDHALEFVKETVECSKRDGVFVVYKPRHCDCDYHLCVGFYKGTTKNYHINKRENAYFLQRFMDDINNSNYYVGDININFKTVTELVEYYMCSSDKILDGNLLWPMLDAEAVLQPDVHFDRKFDLVSKDYTMSNNLIGRGYYADVYSGKLKGGKVAIKIPNIIHDSTIKKELLFREAKILMLLSHENVVKIQGVCFKENKFHMVMECANRGDLRQNIKEGRIRQNLLQDLALQIVKGMLYLESQCIVHRDLALRNILLFENNVPKITDFGSARKLYSPKHTYYISSRDILSHRWTSPEVFATLRYGLKADVWAFGIMLWELYSAGTTPYEHLDTNNVMTFVIQGGVLEKPKRCPDDIYQVMLNCWYKVYTKRPHFGTLKEALYLKNFKKLDPGAVPSFMNELQYANATKAAMSLETFKEIATGIEDGVYMDTSTNYYEVPE